MKHLKTYENYLTKKDQPKDTYDEYLYDRGFGDTHYICMNCGRKELTPIPTGGVSPPKWKCDICGKESYAPSWKSPEEYQEWLRKQEIEKYNL